MSKLEQQLRLSLITKHVEKAADFVRRADLAISESVRVVHLQHAEEHLEDAAQLRAEMQELAS
jgi:hypothetical protein